MGHAVSKDLIFWGELPIAIPRIDNVSTFSDCALVDYDNVTGFEKPAMIALYTRWEKGSI